MMVDADDTKILMNHDRMQTILTQGCGDLIYMTDSLETKYRRFNDTKI